MDESEQGHAGRIGAKRAGSHADALEAVGLEEVDFEAVPSAFRSDGEQKTRPGLPAEAFCNRGAHRPGRSRIGDQSKFRPAQFVQFILHQNPEAAVDRNLRQAGIAGLLQAFDQQGAISIGSQDVGVEIGPLHPFRVGEDDAMNAEGGELGP